jgi:putative tricarboxylic transport membrane protein
LSDARLPFRTLVTGTSSWHDIAPCKESGIDVNYVMLRGTFLPAGVTAEQVEFYVDLFKQVRQTAEWRKFMEEGAFNTTFMTGSEFEKWAAKAEAMHRDWMRDAGFLAKD